MMHHDRVRLLYGPPPLKRGQRVTCAIRSVMRVTNWTDGRLPWPKGVVIGRRSAPSIVVDDELARALRHESAVAIRHWWGVSAKTVAMWRRELDVRRADPEGSRRLIQAAAKAGAAVIKTRVWTAAELRARSRRATKLGLGRHLDHTPKWTAEQIGLLAIFSDRAIATHTGRTANAVRQVRRRFGIASVGGIVRRRWTTGELGLLRSGRNYLEIARLTGRTPNAVSVMRAKVRAESPASKRKNLRLFCLHKPLRSSRL